MNRIRIGRKSRWTEDELKSLAEKCQDRRDFAKRHNSAYQTAHRRGLLARFFGSYPNRGFRTVGRNHWTPDRLKREAAKHETRMEMKVGSFPAFRAAEKKNLLDKIFADHPNQGRQKVKHGTWLSKENCAAKARKYKTRTEFARMAKGAYYSALVNGWLDEICGHMRLCGNLMNRFIYAIELTPEKEVYVGLAHDPQERFDQHKRQGEPYVQGLIERGGQLRILTDLLPLEEIKSAEDLWMRKYRNTGWTVLNIAKAGGLGGNLGIWDEKSLQESANQCSSRSELEQKYPGAYGAALRKGLVDKIFQKHINKGKIKRDAWTFDELKQLVSEVKSRSDFAERFSGAYQAAHENGWLDLLFTRHSSNGFKKKLVWTYEELATLTSMYSTRRDFGKEHGGAYATASKNRWLDRLFAKHPNKGYVHKRRKRNDR